MNLIDELESKVKDCNNTNTIFNTKKYVLLEDAKEILSKSLTMHAVGNWVTFESNIPPEVCTDVMVKYKDGWKEVAYFDGDNRFYIEKDDRDVTETIVSWCKLP